MPDGHPTDEWLRRVFTTRERAELTAAYNAWAGRYEADMLAVGYMHPFVAAGLVGRYVGDRSTPILDAGTGSGLLGQVLEILGYRDLNGLDMSEGMLAQASARGVYRDLRCRVLGESIDYPDGAFGAVVSIGTLNIGHAPAAALDELVRVTRPGGRLILTIPTRAWEQGGFGEKVEELREAGRWRSVETTEPYRPMPLSPSEGQVTTRMFVFAVNGTTAR